MKTPLCEIHRKIVDYCGGDEWKALTWFETPNPFFGGAVPYDVILSGGTEKLFKWIDNQRPENAPVLERIDPPR